MNKERIIKFIAGLSLFFFTVTTQCKGPNQLYGEVPIMLLLGCVFLAILILCIITACMFFYFLDNITFKKSLLLSIIINAIPPLTVYLGYIPTLYFWIHLFRRSSMLAILAILILGLITLCLVGVLITIYTLKICFKYPYKKLLIPVLIVNVIIAFLLFGVKLGAS